MLSYEEYIFQHQLNMNRINKILDFTLSIGEAINFIKKQIKDLQFENALQMIRELVKALQHCMFDLFAGEEIELVKESRKIIIILDRAVTAYRQKDSSGYYYLLTVDLAYYYQNWIALICHSLRNSFS